IGRHFPQSVRQPFNDARPTQRFESPHMGCDEFLWVTVTVRLALGDRQMMVATVQTIARECGDGTVRLPYLGRAAYAHHRAGRVVGQFVARTEGDVVRFAIQTIDDQITSVTELIG